MRFDREKVFSGLKRWEGHSLAPKEVSGITFILDSMEKDKFLSRIEWAAYMLATTKHETAHTYQPIHEYGTHARFVRLYGSQTALGRRLGNDTPEEGAIYAGEGDVQLTGETNYEKVEDALRAHYPEIVSAFELRTGKTFDLTVGDQPNDIHDPENAGDPAIAYAIMSYGMRTGLFTGLKLSDFTHHAGFDSLHARKIINGMDSALIIAGYYKYWLAILIAALIPDLQAPAQAITLAPPPAPVQETPQVVSEPVIPQEEVLAETTGGDDTPQLDGPPDLSDSVKVETVAAEPEAGFDATLTRWSARYATIPGFITAALAGVWAKISESPTQLVIVLAVIAGAIVILYVIGRQITEAVKHHIETRLKDAREQRAHEVQLALINAAASKTLNAVQLIPPPAELPNSDAPEEVQS